ncbi:nucleotidyl transferase AbiEii/AbiGii toxin family protein [Kushneria aurantia]|uniref:Nucleotidyl transferase AbiEii/AbiGii toxin family protein n=1 Tax=Kushneria aurantia TaxID=504092 RepID=A0ABV6G481_9GAMM|nr:nucleotidyl transferase AbiEii/AbiGii toxin family protein [Kushneria aurantia]
MFERPHHQRIEKILHAFNCDLLSRAECYFGGGTAIVLSLVEYRESFDIDFLCASRQGYRLLRNIISQDSLGALLEAPLSYLREVRADRYGIRTVLDVDGVPVKVEIVSEARIEIQGCPHPVFQVPTLSREDMYAEKLLANADRGLDKSTMSRDIIDLAMMIDHWGAIPDAAWAKVRTAYGEHVVKAFRMSSAMVCNRDHLKHCLNRMHMDEGLIDRIPKLLDCPPSP